MKKKLFTFLCLAMCVILCIALCACGETSDGGNDKAPTDGTGTGDSGTGESGDSTGGSGTGGSTGGSTIENDDPLPTAAQVVEARQAVCDLNEENYDFSLKINGTLNYQGFSGTANANYEGKYRYNKTTNDLSFYRETSGILLSDSQEYIYTENGSKIKIVANEKGKIKKVSVVGTNDKGLSLVNLPFVKLIDALNAENLIDIKLNGSGNGFKYQATLKLESDFSALQGIYDALAKFDTDIELSGVTFTNPNNGIVVYFNMDGDELKEFTFGAEIKVPVAGQLVSFKITYEHKLGSGNVLPPSIKSFKLGENCSDDIAVINNALATLKNDDAYSLDVAAINDFDPGWNVTATVDKFLSRVYKNTVDGFVNFNDTYEYVAHTETEGKETYKYTIGNIEDGSVYIVSRKGKNTVTPLSDVSVDTRFDYLTAPFIIDASKVDCLSKTIADGVTTYQIGIKDEYTVAMQDKILEMVNSNNVEGVIKAENYFNNEFYNIKSSELIVAMRNGKIESITVETNVKYCPTDGEWVDSNVTLKNTLQLLVNSNLDKAKKYTAPSSTGNVVGLSSASKAIR